MRDSGRQTLHHFTVDVEEYFHPTALAEHFPATEWEGLERRSPRVIDRLLQLLEQKEVLGTFFVVGWLAKREPGMVRDIAAGGHEIASHGNEHELINRLGRGGFRNSVRESKQALEDIVGRPVLGYRAPSFSIVPGLEWAFDILLEEGYAYDASLFPIGHHPTYGYPAASYDPYWIEREVGALAEFPATTAALFGRRLPASGGAYFRLLPYALTRMGLRQATERDVAGMFYIHPWELDSWTPRVRASRLQRTRTFAGRSRIWPRLDRLLSEFRFGPIELTLTTMKESRSELMRRPKRSAGDVASQ
jgi:polysaccharide deacetylase family protein (PEP-CTERM system associated)